VAYRVGSLYIKTGTPAELGPFVIAQPYILKTEYVYSGTAGSYTVFIETHNNN
jgi:hypothetical protein